MSCIVNSIVYGEEVLKRHGATKQLIDEIRKHDYERIKPYIGQQINPRLN